MPCALALAGCLVGSSALADDATERATPDAQQAAAPQDEARRRFSRGLELYREADYPAALIEFRRAYALIPNYKILYNVGQVCYQLQNYACALQSFEQYLSEGGAEVVAPRSPTVESDIEKLRTRVAKLTIRTNVRGATISIDDVVIGKAPLDAVVVSAGARRISASVDGRPPIVRSVSVAGEENTTIELEFSDSSRGKGDSNVSTANAGRATQSSIPSWPFWLTTAGLAAGAGVAGFLATKSNSTLQDQRATFGISHHDLEETQSRASTRALVSDILTGAAVISGGVALYITLSPRKRTETPPPTSPQAYDPNLRIGVGLNALSVRGSF